MKNKFEFYEVVQINSSEEDRKQVHGLIGTILGMAQNKDGTWGYSVHLEKLEESWCMEEKELMSKNEFKKREDFYDGDSITVVVDPETGEGRLKEDN